MTVKIRYDPTIDAVDIELGIGTVKETREIAPEVLLDLGATGKPMYLEILGASTRYPRIELGDIKIDLGSESKKHQTPQPT